MAPSPQQQPKKTFFLSNFEAVSGGRISIGNIFEDPFSINEITTDTLSKPVAKEDLDFLATNQKSLPSKKESVRESRSHSWSAELWAKFVTLLNLNVGAKRAANSSVIYEIDEMRTVWLDDGIRAYANKRVTRESELNNIVNGVPPTPVYMVIGIKYAKGLRVWIEESASSSGTAKAGANLSGDGFSASGGGGGEGGKKVTRVLARQIDDEVVFAYHLAEITKTKVGSVPGGFLSDRSKVSPGDLTLNCVELAAEEEQVRDVADKLGLQQSDYELESLELVSEGEAEPRSDDELAYLFLH
ncbi:hypothetical protein G7Z17_g2994 [Cylindrodendrum hubeiense]|uniref:Uncharacterized protein n=1 Tax=Cylindrodendrum hubeiense TaxID=595255 RepID=A0A9P5LB59_9HYPO|nr:hypothetical protein G7Z17_g2994 [Cylindrodendrum hubeiense]